MQSDLGNFNAHLECVKSKLFKITTMGIYVGNLQILDEGNFLHRVIWQRGAKISTICESCIKFKTKNYHIRRCTVVFDVYFLSTRSTKEAEQQRQYRLSVSGEFNLNPDTDIHNNQEDFLCNRLKKVGSLTFLR
uniref:Uncharacterized protein n=1 Tax=Clastoptera arizonana TaxID=38151 RepID=A0A1B6CJ44_9HEMI